LAQILVFLYFLTYNSVCVIAKDMTNYEVVRNSEQNRRVINNKNLQ